MELKNVKSTVSVFPNLYLFLSKAQLIYNSINTTVVWVATATVTAVVVVMPATKTVVLSTTNKQ